MIKVIGNNLTIPEGKINLDCEFSKSIGFTTEAGFDKDCYMWGFPDSNGIMLSLIICRKKGGFRNLMENLQKRGYIFRIPNPSNRMVEIGKKQGWFYGRSGELFILTNEKPTKRRKKNV